MEKVLQSTFHLQCFLPVQYLMASRKLYEVKLPKDFVGIDLEQRPQYLHKQRNGAWTELHKRTGSLLVNLLRRLFDFLR